MKPNVACNRNLKNVLLVGALIIIFISSVSFSYRHYTINETNEKLREIESKLSDVRAVMDLGSLRLHNIQKILTIINQYNQGLAEKVKLEIANEIHEMCLKYSNLNVDLVCATITHESALSWNAEVVSPAGALGLMQIMPETGRELAAEEGIRWTTPEKVLFDPIINIRLGCRYLSYLIQQYEIDGGLAAYNGGERRAKLWLEKRNDKSDLTLLWEETQVYVPTILKLYAQYQSQKRIL
ncbi:MAG TPA: lytic transglycosylase domain-containing protein [bacterium]|nr:lytic transglycosylase domain-containing protein [bacterium]